MSASPDTRTTDRLQPSTTPVQDLPEVQHLLSRLQAGEEVDTRTWLRIIFRWLKKGADYDEKYAKSFALTKYLRHLEVDGQPSLGIPPQSGIQPSYGFNAMVTQCQRAGDEVGAEKVFKAMKAEDYQPDVFTYTALIDVLSRKEKGDEALDIYREMRDDNIQPNVVTWTTCIRAAVHSQNFVEESRQILQDVRKDSLGAPDALIYETLSEMCLQSRDLDAATAFLRERKEDGVPTTEKFLLYLIRLLIKEKRCRKSHSEVVDWVEEGLLPNPEEFLKLWEFTENSPKPRPSKKVGCLGPDCSEDIRLGLVHDDLYKLAKRISIGEKITRDEFETLLHTCRKRKWGAEVYIIVDRMRKLATEGSEDPPLPPQPHLVPDTETYNKMMEAIIAVGNTEQAWDVYDEMCSGERWMHPDHMTYRMLIEGSLRTAHWDEAIGAFDSMKKKKLLVPPCQSMGQLYSLHSNPAVAPSRVKIGDGLEADDEEETEEEAVARVEITIYRILLRGLALGSQLERCQAVLNDLETSVGPVDARTLVILLEGFATAGCKEGFDFTTARCAALPTLPTMDIWICALKLCTCLSANSDSTEAREEHLMKSLNTQADAGHCRRDHWVQSVLREAAGPILDHVDPSDRELVVSKSHRALEARRKWMEEFQPVLDTIDELPKMGVDDGAVLKDYVQLAQMNHSNDDAMKLIGCVAVQHIWRLQSSIRSSEEKQTVVAILKEAFDLPADSYGASALLVVCAIICSDTLELARGQSKLSKFVLDALPHLKAAMSGSTPCRLLVEKSVHCVSLDVLTDLIDLTGAFSGEEQVLVDRLMQLNDAHPFRFKMSRILVLLSTKELLHLIDTSIVVPSLASALLNGDSAVIQTLAQRCPDLQLALVQELIDRGENDHAARCIKKYKLMYEASLAEFLKMMTAEEDEKRKARRAEVAAAMSHESRDYMKNPLCGKDIVFVDTAEGVAASKAALCAEGVDAIGIDAEWKPGTTPQGHRHPCATLQLASRSVAFIYDLLALKSSDFEECFREMFSAPTLIKLGFGIGTDLLQMKHTFPEATCFDELAAVVDLHDIYQTMGRRSGNGLSALTRDVIGCELDKREQTSDWEIRPLTHSQLDYASLDAVVLVLLYDKIGHDVCKKHAIKTYHTPKHAG